MAIYYVDPVNGNDADDGLSWANAFLTLNGAEDEPVAAGDTVYVGPGVYRETLTVDVDGGIGNEIVYIGDVTGEHTDSVGGIVRITGSDNDQTEVRASCITAAAKDYRVFRGFSFDTSSGTEITLTASCTDWIIEDCIFHICGGSALSIATPVESSNITIRRSLILLNRAGFYCIVVSGAAIQNANILIENCDMFFGYGRGIQINTCGGITVRNCTMTGGEYGIRITAAPPGGYTANVVENCALVGNFTGLRATALGEIVEDYNTFYRNSSPRTNVAVGANSETYPPLFLSPILHAGVSQISGFKFPWWFGELSEWSQIRAITGSNEPTEDLRGIARPVTASKNSWGACQFADMERETGTVHAGSVSMVLHDAGRHQIWVPVANESTTISVYVYREANYAGNLPQMIVKQPGQADDVTTDAAAAGQWNLLTTTLTPAADPPYVVVELISRNTNGANDKVFFDDLAVS